MRKGYVVFDLAALHGTAVLVSGKALDRSHKAALELNLANFLLRSLTAEEGITVTEIRSNPNDPPDVLFEVGEQTLGMELAELLPENRLERDDILRRVKQKVLALLQFSEKTKDWVVTIWLVDDYASRISLPHCETALATALDAFFVRVTPNARSRAEIPVPGALDDYVDLITVEPCDLSGDPRVRSRIEPLIVFTAQHTNVVPDREFPQLIHQVVQRKELHDLTMPTWLLLWSNHYAFGPLRDHLVKHIDQYLTTHPSKYARVFYLHLHPFGDITEFLSETKDRSSLSQGGT